MVYWICSPVRSRVVSGSEFHRVSCYLRGFHHIAALPGDEFYPKNVVERGQPRLCERPWRDHTLARARVSSSMNRATGRVPIGISVVRRRRTRGKQQTRRGKHRRWLVDMFSCRVVLLGVVLRFCIFVSYGRVHIDTSTIRL